MPFAKQPHHNWARTANNAIGALLVTGIIVAVLAWSVVLPTVGLLYSFGAMP